MRAMLGTVILAAMVLAAGCGGEIENARSLASALRSQGVDYRTIDEITLPDLRGVTDVDEAIALSGENLRVEIYRAESERTYRLLFTAVALGGVVEQSTPDRSVDGLRVRSQAYPKQPFIILVRQEPEAGIVKAALERVFPGDQRAD